MKAHRVARRPFDPANPPAGVRLELGSTAAEYLVPLQDLADAAGISKTAMHALVTANRWPVKTDRAAIEFELRELFRARGATDDELARLFHAHVRRARPGHTPPADLRPPLALQPRDTAAEAAPTDTADPTVDAHPEDFEMLLAKQSLTMQARKAFALFTNPFDGEVTSEAEMFTSGEIAYVREACWQAAVGSRFVAVIGESGAGKTTIQADLEARIERDRKQCIVIKPSVLGMEDNDTKGKTLKSTDILSAMLTTLDPLQPVPQTLEARTTRAEKALSRSTEAGYQHLLLIEEAHCLPDATLKHLKRLHERMKFGRKPMLGILLLAQPELALKLDPRRAILREVTQRCEVVQLLPLDGDLQAYLEHRAKAAGRELGDFIDDGGVQEIRARLTVQRPSTSGKARTSSLLYPLAVNNLMTACLNTAAELGAPKVSRDVVRAV